MNLNFHTVKKCFVQCLLLAGPGVVIGTAMMGMVAKYVVPADWHWNWKMALCFGSITAATDPVAVLAEPFVYTSHCRVVLVVLSARLIVVC